MVYIHIYIYRKPYTLNPKPLICGLFRISGLDFKVRH